LLSSLAELMKMLLFLCTGNYYRSRYAEELFNHRAAGGGLRWTAQSRGLAIERGMDNIGPLSPFVLEALEQRGLRAQGAQRLPRQCAAADFAAAGHIVALDESEHRPLLRERFPAWESRTEYWQVGDVEVVAPKIALRAIDRQIDALLGRLQLSSGA
jgi:low molecular weight protein-tyrosine phosphatase